MHVESADIRCLLQGGFSASFTLQTFKMEAMFL
jgi:hypothetical protein